MVANGGEPNSGRHPLDRAGKDFEAGWEEPGECCEVCSVRHGSTLNVLPPLTRDRISRITSTKDPTEQARALMVKEAITKKHAQHVLDRYHAGCMLFAPYSRARWSDMSNISALDFDYVETDLGVYEFAEARTRVQQNGYRGREEVDVHALRRTDPWAEDRTAGHLVERCFHEVGFDYQANWGELQGNQD